MQATTLPPQFPSVIHSKNDGVVYLALRPCADNHGIVISEQPSRKGLNSFWKVWAREELSKMPAKYVQRIDITKRGVRFVSDRPVDEWIWAAYRLLANVVRLGEPPVRLYEWHNYVEGGERLWVNPRADLTQIVDNITLPRSMHQHYSLFGGVGSIFIVKRGTSGRNCVFRLREVRQYVEWQIALACHHHGVPLNLDYRPIRLLYTNGNVVA